MRNQNNKKTASKLSLSKETLKKLTSYELEIVAGGAPTADCTMGCTSSGPTGGGGGGGHTRRCHTHHCHP